MKNDELRKIINTGNLKKLPVWIIIKQPELKHWNRRSISLTPKEINTIKNVKKDIVVFIITRNNKIIDFGKYDKEDILNRMNYFSTFACVTLPIKNKL